MSRRGEWPGEPAGWWTNMPGNDPDKSIPSILAKRECFRKSA
jgi:hypothetical protein